MKSSRRPFASLMLDALREVVDESRSELMVISPYFFFIAATSSPGGRPPVEHGAALGEGSAGRAAYRRRLPGFLAQFSALQYEVVDTIDL